MPRVDDLFLDCTFYVYRSAVDATSGELGTDGASGFWISVDLEINKGWSQGYAVTNSHVIRNAGLNPVIRVNLRDGGFDLLATNAASWKHHPDGCDIAALAIEPNPSGHRVVCVPDDLLITRQAIQAHNIGPGDETFMVGRFVNHEGKQKNTPALRFGNLAMMPEEPIRDSNGILQESFLVECRSIPGYSGSPVFVYIPPGAPRPSSLGWLSPAFGSSMVKGPWLLGIDWCHLNNLEPIMERGGNTRAPGDYVVKSNTGMAGVIPAWKITELLNIDEFRAAREQEDEALARHKLNSPAGED